MAATALSSVLVEALVSPENFNIGSSLVEVLTAPDLGATKVHYALIEALVSVDGGDLPWQGERLHLPKGWQGGVLRASRFEGRLRRR
jgi:hypothetical protein